MIGKGEIDRFIAEGMYSDETVESYRRTLARFVEVVRIGVKGWEARAIGFRDATKCGTYGKALYVATARSFLNWCLNEGLIEKNPLKKIRIRVPTVSNRSALTDEEIAGIQTMFTKLAKKSVGRAREFILRDRAAIMLMLYTGMRVGGVIRLDIEDFSLNGDTAVVRYRGKGSLGKDSTVNVTEKPLTVIAHYLTETKRSWDKTGAVFLNRFGRRVAYTGLSKSIIRRFSEAGVRKDASIHWLRHTAATKALRSGADLRAIQKMLGQKHLTATERYVHSLEGIENSAEGKIDYD